MHWLIFDTEPPPGYDQQGVYPQGQPQPGVYPQGQPQGQPYPGQPVGGYPAGSYPTGQPGYQQGQPAVVVSLCTCNIHFLALKCFFLTHQFKHMIWILKRTVSLRRLF